ncbi:MAG: hypothetical protein FWB76_00970 [Oscillospiraceae bacterium]|nr:hypothetical protein [Oscillospiraceae bacterium]
MMKRVLALVAVLLLLAACVGVAEPVGTDVTPPDVEATTEETTTTQPARVMEPFVIAVEVDEADPFSFVLRAYAEFAQWARELQYTGYEDYEEWLALLAQWEAEQPLLQHFTMLEGIESVWQSAMNKSRFSMHMYYARHDIDGDGVDELLIGFARGLGEPELFDIYAMIDGVPMQQLQNPGRNPRMDVFSGGVSISGGRMGSYWQDIFLMVEGQLQFSTGLRVGERAIFDDEYNMIDLIINRYIVREPWDWENYTPITAQQMQVIAAEHGGVFCEYFVRWTEVELYWRPLFVPA